MLCCLGTKVNEKIKDRKLERVFKSNIVFSN
jgi:hypothetical protein